VLALALMILLTESCISIISRGVGWYGFGEVALVLILLPYFSGFTSNYYLTSDPRIEIALTLRPNAPKGVIRVEKKANNSSSETCLAIIIIPALVCALLPPLLQNDRSVKL
jgi:hypothetical protein